MAQDPVCKMEVEEGKAGATSVYQGETYYFCSANCKDNFEKEPEKYAGKSGGHEHGHHHH